MKYLSQQIIYRAGRPALLVAGVTEMPLPSAPGVVPPGLKLLATNGDDWMRLAKTIAVLRRPVRRGGSQRQRRARRASARALLTLSAWVKVNPGTTVFNPQLEQGKHVPFA